MASCLLGDLGGDGFPLGFVYEVFDLDEFVVVEDLVDVGVGGFGDAVSADLDSGFEAVGLFLEASYLSGCEWVHGGSVFRRFLNGFLFGGLGWGAGVSSIFFYFYGDVCLGLFCGVFCCLEGFCGLFWCCLGTV